MKPRILSTVLLMLGLVGAASPALAAKLPPPPVITSATVVDSRTVDLTWTPVKGAHHYVVSAPLHGYLSTTATTMRVTDLYPGDEQTFFVEAQTRRNATLGVSEWVSVPTPPEGPWSPGAYYQYDDLVRLSTGGGIGCFTYEVARVEGDGSLTSFGTVTDQGATTRYEWYVTQARGTTASYVARCQARAGLWSPWSPPTVLTV